MLRYHRNTVIKMKAWPSALHSGPITYVADHVLDRLRAGAMRGVRLDRPGYNPVLYFAMYLHPSYDPEFYLIQQSIRMMRKHLPAEVMEPYLQDIACQVATRRLPGPLNLLCTRLEQLGWTYSEATRWNDHQGLPVDVHHEPIQQLTGRIIEAFQTKHFQQISKRLGFAGAQNAHAWMTQQAMKSMPEDDKTILRALLSGGFITADQLGRAHNVEGDAHPCKFCQQPDSLEHRHWGCPATSPSRQQLTPSAQEWIDQQPECTRQRGWVTAPPSLKQFRQLLSHHSITCSTATDTCSQTVYIFTNGSAKRPNDPLLRLGITACCAGLVVCSTWC